MNKIQPVGNKNAILLLRAFSEKVQISDDIERYIISLVSATRQRSEFSLGASPRASLALMKLARAGAILAHRDYVIPEDVANIYCEAVAHRVSLTREASANGISAEKVLEHILATTPVPFLSRTRRIEGFGGDICISLITKQNLPFSSGGCRLRPVEESRHI